MKKCILLLSIVLMTMVLLVPACADDVFSLRNGIQFGDTKEQVRAKETIEIDEYSCSDTRIETKKGTVAGIDDVCVTYEFSDDNKLIEVKWYCWKFNDDLFGKEYINSSYDKIKSAMQSKYGEPLPTSNGNFYVIRGSVSNVALYGPLLDRNNSLRDYAEWDYEYQTGEHVKIEIVMNWRYSTSFNTYELHVGYKHFTSEDLDNARQEKESKDKDVLNDI